MILNWELDKRFQRDPTGPCDARNDLCKTLGMLELETCTGAGAGTFCGNTAGWDRTRDLPGGDDGYRNARAGIPRVLYADGRTIEDRRCQFDRERVDRLLFHHELKI